MRRRAAYCISTGNAARSTAATPAVMPRYPRAHQAAIEFDKSGHRHRLVLQCARLDLTSMPPPPVQYCASAALPLLGCQPGCTSGVPPHVCQCLTVATQRQLRAICRVAPTISCTMEGCARAISMGKGDARPQRRSRVGPLSALHLLMLAPKTLATKGSDPARINLFCRSEAATKMHSLQTVHTPKWL